MPLGQVLYRPGSASRHVYFPTEGMVSLLAVVAERRAGLEVGLVGREGMVGIPLALGVSTSPVKALVQGAGSAMRMSAARLGSELKRNRPLQRALDRCAYVAMATAMQIAVCNKTHLLEARLARWLLMTHDRVTSDEFRFTQEFIARMVGTTRSRVNHFLGKFKKLGFVEERDGALQLNPALLFAVSGGVGAMPPAALRGPFDAVGYQ